MQHTEAAQAAETIGVVAGMASGLVEGAELRGRFDVVCRDADGNVLWEDSCDNVVCTLGKNAALDAFLAGAAYTVTGPFLGLISSVGFTAVAAADTQVSHAGWVEAGGANAPTMSSTRGLCAWSVAAAGSKTLSAGLVFTFTGPGTVQGLFLVLGAGAVSTVGSTAGVLYSAGALGTPQPVIATNTVTATYTGTM